MHKTTPPLRTKPKIKCTLKPQATLQFKKWFSAAAIAKRSITKVAGDPNVTGISTVANSEMLICTGRQISPLIESLKLKGVRSAKSEITVRSLSFLLNTGAVNTPLLVEVSRVFQDHSNH